MLIAAAVVVVTVVAFAGIVIVGDALRPKKQDPPDDGS